MTAQRHPFIAVVWLACVASLVVIAASTSATVVRFDFIGDRSGDPNLRFAGVGFVDRDAFRYDYSSGNHPLFREGISIRSADGGRILSVIDNREGNYFFRSTEQMSGIMANFRAPWQKGIETPSVVVENLGRATSIGGLQISHIRIAIRYRVLMEFEGERLGANIDAVGDLLVAPKYRVPALPWGHQFALKTGWPELDRQIAREVVKLGLPIEQTVEVTRTIDGGIEDTERSTFRVVGLREVAFVASGFSPPPGYRATEPALIGPSIAHDGREYAESDLETPPAETGMSTSEPVTTAPAEDKEPVTSPTLYVETMEVRVISIDVVVRDKKGDHAPGLTPEAFEILENGQPVEITNFAEMSASMAPSQSNDESRGPDQAEVASGRSTEAFGRTRKIVLFFDQNALHPAHRKKLVPAMKQFIEAAMRPGDEAMIASFANALQVDLQFTSNRDVVLEVLDRMEERLNIGRSRASQLARTQQLLWDHILDFEFLGGRPPYETGLAECRAYADAVTHDTNMVIGSLEALIKGLEAIDGRKILVIATESLPARPGNEIFTFFNGIKQFFAGGERQQPLTETQRYDLTPLINGLADTANASGFTLYPIQAETLSEGFVPADLTSTMAVRFTESAIGVDAMRKMSDAEGLQAIAHQTGGVATLGANDFGAAFGSILEDLDQYYSMGYRAGPRHSDFVRSITVRMKDQSLTARARRSIVDRSIEKEIEEYVAANLFYPISRNDLGITIRTTEPVPAGESATLKLTVDVPISSVTVVPHDEELLGKLVTFVGFVRADGSVSRIARVPREFRLPVDSMTRRKSITLALEVIMDRTTNRISVGVLDPTSNSTGFASVFVPGQPPASGRSEARSPATTPPAQPR